MNPSCKLPRSMTSSSTKMLQISWTMRGSNSKMLQIPLKWQNAANSKDYGQNRKSEKNKPKRETTQALPVPCNFDGLMFLPASSDRKKHRPETGVEMALHLGAHPSWNHGIMESFLTFPDQVPTPLFCPP